MLQVGKLIRYNIGCAGQGADSAVGREVTGKAVTAPAKQLEPQLYTGVTARAAVLYRGLQIRIGRSCAL